MRFKYYLLIIIIFTLINCSNKPTINKILIVGSGHYKSIQEAIKNANNNDTIEIQAGNYIENIIITKPLKISGNDSTNCVLESIVNINNVDKLEIKNLKFISKSKILKRGLLTNNFIININNSNVNIDNCIIAGGYSNGIEIKNNSQIIIKHSLIAGLWGTGIRIKNNNKSIHIINSEIRNNYYAGVTIGSNNVTIDNCLISGSAWHGIRYDNCSPNIENNLIFKNARCGIYASGKTKANIINNIFYSNEMSAISCWFQNNDIIYNNTIIKNYREGIGILGNSSPDLKNNIFYNNNIAIVINKINSKSKNAQKYGNPNISNNVFWENKNLIIKENKNIFDKYLKNHQYNPKFINNTEKNFILQKQSKALKNRIGATNALNLNLMRPLLEEEKSIIPVHDTRDCNKWKTN